MLKFEVKWDASEDRGCINLELNYTEEEWDAFTDEEKEDLIQDELNENPNQPYMMVDKFYKED